MRFSVKVIRTRDAVLVNICDLELLGKEFREGEVVLKVSKGFYGGEIVGEEEARNLILSGDIVSLVGERAISLAVEVGMASWKYVKRVNNIPHLNIYRL